MKICHFICDQGIGRGEAYVTLANEQAKTDDVIIVAPVGARYLENLGAGVRFVGFKQGHSRNNPFLYLELAKLFKAIDPDIVHSHYAKATEVFRRLNWVLKLPHIATKHNPRKGPVFDRLRPVVAVSTTVAKSIAHGEVHIIPNGIPTPAVKSIAQPHPNMPFRMTAVGRLEKIKGYDYLIDAVLQIPGAWQLDIIGEGPERANLEKRIAAAEATQQIFLRGFQSDIQTRLSETDLFIITSHSEGGPLTALEALHSAPVMISTPVGIVPDILPPMFLTELSQLKSKITTVMENYGEFEQEFQRIVQKRRADFSITACADAHRSVYQDMLA